MATIALPRPIVPHRPTSALGSISSTITIEALSSHSSQCPAPVPNKHIPICPPGPATAVSEPKRPSSPASSREHEGRQQSLLFPPDSYRRLESSSPTLYAIDAQQLAAALAFTASQPIPDPAQVFPWFHGLHPSNHIQQAFFIARRRSLRKTPCCLRGVALVKADGDLAVSRLKGAIAPDELLQPSSPPEFLDADPREGFSVRNFQIQAPKAAMTSDIVVYGDDGELVRRMARDIASAQQRWRDRHLTQGHPLPVYNTFVCTSSFAQFEQNHPELVAVNSSGRLTGNVVDFFHQERVEMYAMTQSSEISHNVWIGPTPEPASEEERFFDILIECSDTARINPEALGLIAEGKDDAIDIRYLEFPSSGSIMAPTWSHTEADGILETCKWMYHLAHGTRPLEPEQPATDPLLDGDVEMGGTEAKDNDSPPKHRERKILLHCADGYTESTMLGIAYFSFSTGHPVPDAWLHLHTTQKRNFFAYPTDVGLLTAIAPRLLHESPKCAGKSLSDITELVKNEPKWLPGMDGSFPSRITDYMYLGNLGHANNPDLLKVLGIGQILSVGETAMWREGELEQWGEENICVVQGVQDNGIDPLTDEFERCLDFIDRGRLNRTATLVHCRVGVSRSATICIAEVMRSLGLSFPRAYCFVRARRLNVIIQPHLRFAYELLKWEELLQSQGAIGNSPKGSGIKRELEWGEIAREIALMNRPYAR